MYIKKIRATNIIIYGIIENAGLKVFIKFFNIKNKIFCQVEHFLSKNYLP